MGHSETHHENEVALNLSPYLSPYVTRRNRLRRSANRRESAEYASGTAIAGRPPRSETRGPRRHPQRHSTRKQRDAGDEAPTRGSTAPKDWPGTARRSRTRARRRSAAPAALKRYCQKLPWLAPLFLCIFTVLLCTRLWSALHPHPNPLRGWRVRLPGARPPRYAYATLLCGDARMLRAVSVLLRSLRTRGRTAYPILVLTTPDLPTAAQHRLEQLGGTVIRRPPLPYPFDLNAGRLRDNKPCRYSKLHLWSLTEYDKIVFLDGDTLVLWPLDDLFHRYGELSAAPDLYPDTFNSGVMVLQPRLRTYRQMLQVYRNTSSYNLGDQGFLNAFFGERWMSDHRRRHLPLSYNVLLKYRDTLLWSQLENHTRVLHFTGETKPWNWHRSSHHDWERQLDPEMYYLWMQVDREVRNVSLPPDVQQHCDAEAAALRRVGGNLQRRFPLRDRYSVVIGTYDRADLLQRLLHTHYRHALWRRSNDSTEHTDRLIDKIFIVWHDPQRPPPADWLRGLSRSRIQLVVQQRDSLNNRFNPLGMALRTRAVLIVDDDIRVRHDDTAFAFRVWQDQPHTLVGFFPRFHHHNEQRHKYEYLVSEPLNKSTAPADKYRRYSIVLTKHMFMRSEYLFYYRCLLPDERIHHYVDRHRNCEDIACQCMVTGMSGAAPIAVRGAQPAEDYGAPGAGRPAGISAAHTHLVSRSQCVHDFLTEFWANATALRYNEVVLERFVKVPFRKGNASELLRRRAGGEGRRT